MKVYQALAQIIVLHDKQPDLAESKLKNIMQSAPRGSGFDSGTVFRTEDSTRSKLVFYTEYHHMNDAGCYDGWTEHKITVRADLLHGYEMTITGRNRNGIKDYIEEVISYWLNSDVDWLTGKVTRD
jgi:hypothetical protein